MLPTLIFYNAINRAGAYVVFLREDWAIAANFSRSMDVLSAYCYYLFVCQLCLAACFATGLRAVSQAVVGVFQSCAPSKINQRIVGGVTVGAVASLHANRTWANEGQKDECVNVYSGMALAANGDSEITTFLFVTLESLPRVSNNTTATSAVADTFFADLSARPHASIIADTVAGEAKTGQIAVLDSSLNVRHDSLQTVGCG